jgi:periplasmic protein TonB
MSPSLTGRKGCASQALLAGALCLLLQACSQAPLAPTVSVASFAPELTPPISVDNTAPATPPIPAAHTPAEYRRLAARHVYDQHASQLYSGPMPPLLQAVGVLDIEIGAQGEVRGLNWLRAPTHVPEVMRQIEQLVHRAAPYPAPLNLRSVTYTDTWLWHHSGRFQLHTLSEGQLGESGISNAQAPKRRASQRTTSTQTTVLSSKCKQSPSSPAQVSAYC